MKDLPIYPFLPKICEALFSSRSRFLVLTAETAAGKSTAVPIALLPHVSGKIVMLEPRRIATVAVANRIAELLGESTGKTAGYRLHLESRVSVDTRIEVITEAILTRRMQNDPSLTGVSVVIIDEFHERSVHADLALAFLRDAMDLRDDLYVLVMSATIDTEKIASCLDSPVFSVPGRKWPVEIVYAPAERGSVGRVASVEDQCARAALRELEGMDDGSILVFLPGIAEIRRTESLLALCNADVLALHSSVPLSEQKRVLTEAERGKRRVILSSSIAETSITVPGVRTVIDSGLSRVGRINIPTGMYSLETGYESEFSATQRAGRAGRTGPGRCVRLWAEHDVRLQETPPEIFRTDLLSVVLECALWGANGIHGLRWLDEPNRGAWDAARNMLEGMDALDRDGRITPKGRNMTVLGVHPRIAAVALTGNTGLAVRHSQYADNPREQERFRLDLERRLAPLLSDCALGGHRHRESASDAMDLLAGFPDRIARHAGNGIYSFPSGRLASLSREDRSASARYPEWIVAPEVDAGEREGRIRSYEILDDSEAVKWLHLHAVSRIETGFADGKYIPGRKVKKTEIVAYGKIVLVERPLEPDQGDVAKAICQAIRKQGLSVLPWSKEAESFLFRARYCYQASIPTGRYTNRLENMSDDSLLDSLESWLVPFIPPDGRIDAHAVLEALRYRTDARLVDSEAGERISLLNGISRPLAYEEIVPGDGPVPVLEIRIQDLYGLSDTPRVLGKPVLLRLLSPARRPVQITSDLAGFWKNTWPEVRKEMKGRYPKHTWPENPLKPEPLKP